MERVFEYKIDKEYIGKTVKDFLNLKMKCSSNIISQLKKANNVVLNGENVYVTAKLKENDFLRIVIPENDITKIEPNYEIKFDVLFEDDDILVVNKPSGVPTHQSIKHYSDSLANAVCAYIHRDDFVFRAVNRLDLETSGIVVIAKNMLSAHVLSMQIRNKTVKKEYLAILSSIPEKDEGIIILPIAREAESIIKRCVNCSGKYSETRYKILEKKGELCMVNVFPVTGRTHQIRVHFSQMGHPLYSDGLYGTDLGLRTMLHCSKMEFVHPITDKKMNINAPCPNDFITLIK